MRWTLPDTLRDKKIYKVGVIYVIVYVILAAVANYFTWKEGPVTELTLGILVSWGLLYLPFFIFVIAADWRIKEVGITLNKKVFLIVLFSLVVGSYLYIRGVDIQIGKWQYSLIEAFGRTGEELFFRGFVYTLVLKLYQDKKNSWQWAVLVSAVLFTAIHTQTLLPEYSTSIFQVFLISLVITYLRHLTDSILPGITLHCLLKGGTYSVLFGWAIYVIFVFWSYCKGEYGGKK